MPTLRPVSTRSAARPGPSPAQRQLGAAAAGYQPDRHLGQAEHCGGVGHHQVAGQRQLAAAAKGEAVHRGDGGLRQPEHRTEGGTDRVTLTQDVRIGHAGPLFQVRPGAERALPGGTEHDHADPGLGGDLGVGPGEPRPPSRY